jgi:hypothetical protein
MPKTYAVGGIAAVALAMCAATAAAAPLNQVCNNNSPTTGVIPEATAEQYKSTLPQFQQLIANTPSATVTLEQVDQTTRVAVRAFKDAEKFGIDNALLFGQDAMGNFVVRSFQPIGFTGGGDPPFTCYVVSSAFWVRVDTQLAACPATGNVACDADLLAFQNTRLGPLAEQLIRMTMPPFEWTGDGAHLATMPDPLRSIDYIDLFVAKQEQVPIAVAYLVKQFGGQATGAASLTVPFVSQDGRTVLIPIQLSAVGIAHA